jgi:hypothetical protein
MQAVVEAMRPSDGGLMFYLLCNHDTPLENIEALCTGVEKHCY